MLAGDGPAAGREAGRQAGRQGGRQGGREAGRQGVLAMGSCLSSCLFLHCLQLSCYTKINVLLKYSQCKGRSQKNLQSELSQYEYNMFCNNYIGVWWSPCIMVEINYSSGGI